MEFKYVLEGHTLWIELGEELDQHVADQIQAFSRKECRCHLIKKIVFDFSHTEFMDSSGVGLLVGRYREMGFKKGSVVAIGVSKNIHRLFFMSGLLKIITIGEVSVSPVQ